MVKQLLQRDKIQFYLKANPKVSRKGIRKCVYVCVPNQISLGPSLKYPCVTTLATRPLSIRITSLLNATVEPKMNYLPRFFGRSWVVGSVLNNARELFAQCTPNQLRLGSNMQRTAAKTPLVV